MLFLAFVFVMTLSSANFCAVLLFAWVSLLSSAEAGLLSAETMMAQDGGMSATKVSFRSPTPDSPPANPETSSLVSDVPASNMGSNVQVTSGGSSPVMVAGSSELQSRGLLTAYLTRESSIMIAPPFLDGVFRPPKRRAKM